MIKNINYRSIISFASLAIVINLIFLSTSLFAADEMPSRDELARRNRLLMEFQKKSFFKPSIDVLEELRRNYQNALDEEIANVNLDGIEVTATAVLSISEVINEQDFSTANYFALVDIDETLLFSNNLGYLSRLSSIEFLLSSYLVKRNQMLARYGFDSESEFLEWACGYFDPKNKVITRQFYDAFYDISLANVDALKNYIAKA